MMTKRRKWYGLGVGMVAAVALLSGCSSKDRRLATVSGANGLLGSREIIPAPMGSPSELKLLPQAALQRLHVCPTQPPYVIIPKLSDILRKRESSQK